MFSIDDINFLNKKVIIRVDFNVPFDNNNHFYDMSRIDLSLETIRKVLNNGGVVILMSHLGNPSSSDDKKYSLFPLVSYLSKVLKVKVKFICNYLDTNVIKNVLDETKSGDVILLENLRFHKGEKLCDDAFAKLLSKWGDIYINDAFSASHRNHASISLLPKYFIKKCFGYLMMKEIKHLNKFFDNSISPISVILGGAKISTKIPLIFSLIGFADYILIGGAMANVFIKGTSGLIGSSKCDDFSFDQIQELMLLCKNSKKTKVFLPIDVICTHVSFNYNCSFNSYSIPYGWKACDIGSETINLFCKILAFSKTILWNGPMGIFEQYSFLNGTFNIATEISNLTLYNNIYSLVGGGDSIAAIHKMKKSFSDFSFVSSGGGAMLKFLEKRRLVGIDKLML